MGRAPRRKPNVAAARMIRWSLIVFLSEGRNGHYHSYRKSALDVETWRGAERASLGLKTSRELRLAERNRDQKNCSRHCFRCEPGLSSVKADWGQAHRFVRLLFR